MKALVYDGVETLGFRDVPDPVAAVGEHLIRVEAVGICGSDMHAYLGHDARRPAPLILGHEAAGTVTGGPMDGTRVTVNPLVTCGTCPACRSGRENLCPTRQIISMQPREGAFAQYISMPQSNLVTVPEAVPLAKAALAEPLAVSWHAVRLATEALHATSERRALVIGGGAIGLAAALALRAMHVADVTIVEPNDARRAFLAALGETGRRTSRRAVPGRYRRGRLCSATRATASASAAPGGVIAHVGLGEDSGGLGYSPHDTCKRSPLSAPIPIPLKILATRLQAIFDGRLGPLEWIEERALSEGAQRVCRIARRRSRCTQDRFEPMALVVQQRASMSNSVLSCCSPRMSGSLRAMCDVPTMPSTFTTVPTLDTIQHVQRQI